MPNNLTPETGSSQRVVYQIRIRGQLGPEWADWFEGLTVSVEDNGETLLTGSVADQAALYGLLKRIRDLGILLISVNPIRSDASGVRADDA